MSHITTQKTNMTSLRHLATAAKALGWELSTHDGAEGTEKFSTYRDYGNTTKTRGDWEIKLRNPTGNYDVVAKFNPTTKVFDFGADLLDGTIKRDLGEDYTKLSQQYAASAIVDASRQQGQTVVSQYNDAKGNLIVEVDA